MRRGSRLPRWRVKRNAAFRRRVLARDVLCRLCGERAATEVDHIVPLARGGADNDGNMQGVCRACHAKKTRRDWAPTPIVDVEGNEIKEVTARLRARLGQPASRRMRDR